MRTKLDGLERNGSSAQQRLAPHARRALQEAEERRRQAERQQGANPSAKEVGGREGLDPVRYGDWEKGGIISDF
jgi:hypothetical protein